MSITQLNIGQKEDTPEKIVATANIAANRKLPMSEFNQVTNKVNEVIQVVNEINIDGKLTGTLASEEEMKIEAPVVEDNKMVSRSLFQKTWTWLKTRQAIISAVWNFTVGLQKNGVDVATINDLAIKLNANANFVLAGLGVSLPVLQADGTITRNDFLKWVTANKELVIGDANNPGKLNIFSEVCEITVQDNIQTGQARWLLNAGQADALSIADKAGNILQTFRTIIGSVGVIARARTMLDAGVFMPITTMQAGITSAGAAVKVFGKDSAGVEISIPFGVAAHVLFVEGILLLRNNSAGTIIVAKFKAVAKNVGGTITLPVNSLESIVTNATYPTFTAGLEVNGTSLRFFFAPMAGDNNLYTGAFTELKFSSTYVL